MNNVQLAGMRIMAKTMETNSKNWRVYDGLSLIMWGLDRQRAETYAKYYKNGRFTEKK